MAADCSRRPMNLSTAATSRLRSFVKSCVASLRPLVKTTAAISFAPKCCSMNSRADRLTMEVRSGLMSRSSITSTYTRPSNVRSFDRTSLVTGRLSGANRSTRSTGSSTYENISIFCGLPSSNTSKSSRVSPDTKAPFSSVTTASTST